MKIIIKEKVKLQKKPVVAYTDELTKNKLISFAQTKKTSLNRLVIAIIEAGIIELENENPIS